MKGINVWSFTVMGFAIIVLCFLTSSSAEAVARPNKVVIVNAGSPAPDSELWESTANISNHAYKILKSLYFNDAEIEYLSADENSSNENVDSYLSSANFENAITQWASDANDLILFMTGKGEPGSLKLNHNETLNAVTLDLWLTTLQSKIPGRITFIYEADYSGSFSPILGKTGRTFIASTVDDLTTNIEGNGFSSFAVYFLNGIQYDNYDYHPNTHGGRDVYSSYQRASFVTPVHDWRRMRYSYDGTFPYNRQDREQAYYAISAGLTYYFETGDNAISVSGQCYTAESLAGAINENGGSITRVSKWDGKKFVKYIAGTNKGDFAIEPGVAYILYSAASSEWHVPRGKNECQKHNFYKGDNYVGFPEGTDLTASSLTEALAQKGHSVKYIHDINRDITYSPRSNKNNFHIIPGDGYIVNSTHFAEINTCR